MVEFDGSPTCQFSLGRQILVLPLPQRRSQIDITNLVRTRLPMSESVMGDSPHSQSTSKSLPRSVQPSGGSFPTADPRPAARRNPLSWRTTSTSPRLSLYTHLLRPKTVIPAVPVGPARCFPPGCEIRRLQGFRQLPGQCRGPLLSCCGENAPRPWDQAYQRPGEKMADRAGCALTVRSLPCVIIKATGGAGGCTPSGLRAYSPTPRGAI